MPQRPGTPRALSPQEALLTHDVWQTGPFRFCRKCGALAERKLVRLAEPCLGAKHLALQKGSSKTRLRRLLAGCHPASGLRIGSTERVRIQDLMAEQ